MTGSTKEPVRSIYFMECLAKNISSVFMYSPSTCIFINGQLYFKSSNPTFAHDSVITFIVCEFITINTSLTFLCASLFLPYMSTQLIDKVCFVNSNCADFWQPTWYNLKSSGKKASVVVLSLDQVSLWVCLWEIVPTVTWIRKIYPECRWHHCSDWALNSVRVKNVS